MLKASFRSIPDQISYTHAVCPEAPALRRGAQQLTYDELERRAGHFAGYLAQAGVRPGDCVAVCLGRSFDWIVAALGIMRAGAAYVPLDPAWPDARLEYAVEDSGAKALLAPANLLKRLRSKAHGVDPDREAAKIASIPQLRKTSLDPQSLAYVIYTSGTTGVPKGVEITHANLSHLVEWHHGAFGVTQKDRASHLAGLGFDAAGWEIWPHLAAGAAVCLVDDSIRSTPHLLQQWMIREGITIGFVPTVHAASMMALEWPAKTKLRFLLTGGDTLQNYPPAGLPFEVVNNYGPTECTVVATSSILRSGLDALPPIGRPINGTKVYLLGEDGVPVPDGSVGEIFVGGPGVGRGYRNLPDLTKKYFLADPFAGDAARMYRTGDRGVRLLNGEIEFRGRLDRQTKIRGQRVELDEIGCALSRHPEVEFATAISLSQNGDNPLVAYVLPRDAERAPSVRELQSHLLATLPDYMIPAVFVQLESVPLSLNGKLDLTKLPEPSDANRLERKSTDVPASPIEEKLLQLVRQVLSNDSVGAEDSFFLAGGHSLLGMQLVMRLRETFGVDVTLRQLFEAPTVEQLAVLVQTILRDSAEPRRNAIFWVQSRSIELAKALGDEYALLSVALTLEDLEPLGQGPSLPAIASCLVRKVQNNQPKGPYRIGGLCLGGILAYEVASQLRAAGETVELLVMMGSPNPSRPDRCDSLDKKLNYLRYAMERTTRLGFRKASLYAWEHVRRGFGRTTGIGRKSAHQLTEIAARTYQPSQYDGNVLLLVASERPPHVDFVRGWKVIVQGNLGVTYIDSHARELLRTESVNNVAAAIVSGLDATRATTFPSCCSSSTLSPSAATERLTAALDLGSVSPSRR